MLATTTKHISGMVHQDKELRHECIRLRMMQVYFLNVSSSQRTDNTHKRNRGCDINLNLFGGKPPTT